MIFGNDSINKNTFHKHRKIDVDKRDVNKISISDEDSCGKKRLLKYFIGYKNHKGIRPLYIKLPQMSRYAKYFDSYNKYIFWLIIKNC